MKIPKKIKVGARIYTVKIVDIIKDDCTGLTTHSDLTIQIKKGNQQSMEHTFCHEIFHAFQGGMAENQVEALAGNLHEFIIDNPEVVK